jgi:hypothetical protein
MLKKRVRAPVEMHRGVVVVISDVVAATGND